MKIALLAGTALVVLVQGTAHAQDHEGHAGHAIEVPAPVAAPPPAEAEADNSAEEHSHGEDATDRERQAHPMDQSRMDHSQMPGMDRAQMDHSMMDHGAEEPGRAGHAMTEGPVEASGTSRLPQAEGMMPGLHFDLGGGWMGMAHGHLWGI